MKSMFWFLNDLSISASPQLWSGVHLLVVCGDSLVRVVRQLSFQMVLVASCSLTQDFCAASTATEYFCTIWCRKYQCCGYGVFGKLTFFWSKPNLGHFCDLDIKFHAAELAG